MDWHVSYYAANWSIVYELKRGRQEEEARHGDTNPLCIEAKIKEAQPAKDSHANTVGVIILTA